MAEVMIVALAVGGVSAYVWSVIDQADSPHGTSGSRSDPRDARAAASLPAPLSTREMLSRLRGWYLRSRARTAAERAWAVTASAVGMAISGTAALRARWVRRTRRPFERDGRRIRFEETAELTVPIEPSIAGVARVRTAADEWPDRPSRLLATLGLLLLIVVVGAVLAAVILGIGELVAGAVERGQGA